jgi:hypothetical protein
VKPETRVRKFCPLLKETCRGKGCEWFVKEECILTVIGRRLYDLEEALSGITGRLEAIRMEVAGLG